jgi:hypothetical protein
MKDWRAIAKGQGLEVSVRELDRIVEPLDALEEVFRPLVKHLGPEQEPATVLRTGDEQ